MFRSMQEPLKGEQWRCEGCGRKYAEYGNGCSRSSCWNHDLSREENCKKFPVRGIRISFVRGFSFGRYLEQGFWIARCKQQRILFSWKYIYIAIAKLRFRLDLR